MAAPERAGRGVFAAVRAAEPSLQPGEARAAQAADVSTATVVRCAQKLGFKGFHEIKLTLAQEIAGSNSGRLAEVEPCDPPIEVLRKVAQAGAQAIVDAT